MAAAVRCRRRGRSSSTPAVTTARSGSTWHHEAGLVVLSLWRDNVCAGTFRLEVDEVPDLIDAAALRARPGVRRPAARHASTSGRADAAGG